MDNETKWQIEYDWNRLRALRRIGFHLPKHDPARWQNDQISLIRQAFGAQSWRPKEVLQSASILHG